MREREILGRLKRMEEQSESNERQFRDGDQRTADEFRGMPIAYRRAICIIEMVQKRGNYEES